MYANEREKKQDIKSVAPADLPFLPFTFDIAMGVRRGDNVLRDSLDAVLSRRQHDIDRILADYGVPRADTPAAVGLVTH